MNVYTLKCSVFAVFGSTKGTISGHARLPVLAPLNCRLIFNPPNVSLFFPRFTCTHIPCICKHADTFKNEHPPTYTHLYMLSYMLTYFLLLSPTHHLQYAHFCAI